MEMLRAPLSRIAVLCWTVLLVVGCENAPSVTGVTPDESVGAIADADVFDALARIVSTETAEPADTDAVELPGFGEEADPFAAASDHDTMPYDGSTTLMSLAGEDTEPVAAGTLAGRFANDRPDSNSDESNGAFRGDWMDADGNVVGTIRGEYFALPGVELPDPLTGGGVFRGKLINLDGRFLGFLHGRYGHAEGEPGLFFGRWFDREMRVVGVMRGRWMDDPSTNGGHFHGEWAAFDVCAIGAALPEIEFEDGDFGGYDTRAESVDVAAFNDAAVLARVDIADTADTPVPPCIDPNEPYGFLRGRRVAFAPTDDNPLPLDGGFRGHWLVADGTVDGALLGRWAVLAAPGEGADAAGDDPAVRPFARLGVFHGKIVDSDGEALGFIRGVFGVRWYGLGVFRGEYFDASGEPAGVLRGRWDHTRRHAGGPFFGTWNGDELTAALAPAP